MIPKVKGKSIEEDTKGEWIYGYGNIFGEETAIMIPTATMESWYCIKVDPKTVSIYSEWRDIDKKYIHENDIITIEDKSPKDLVFLVVEFKEGSFKVRNPKGITWTGTYLRYIMNNKDDFNPRMVGNIFDNSELVKEK
jgi:hypothetical protein